MNTGTYQTSFEKMQTLRAHHLRYVDHYAEMLHDFREHLLTAVKSDDLCAVDKHDFTIFASHLNEVVHCAMFGGVLSSETEEYLRYRLGMELISYHDEGDTGAFESLEELCEWMDEMFGVDFNVYKTH